MWNQIVEQTPKSITELYQYRIKHVLQKNQNCITWNF